MAITRGTYIVAACALTVFTMTGAAAGSAARQASSKAVFSAFSLFANGSLAKNRCGSYVVTRGTYTGRSTSPDQRLAGTVTFRGRIVADAAGSGLATGRLTVRDGARNVRMSGDLRGVVSGGRTVGGIVSGSLKGPPALLLANVSLVFGPDLRSATAKLGLEVAHSSGVAYPRLGRCG